MVPGNGYERLRIGGCREPDKTSRSGTLSNQTGCAVAASAVAASILQVPGIPGSAVSLASIALLLAYPAYLLLMAGVLAVCGVKRREIAKWALRQADRQRMTDLIRLARGSRHPTVTDKPAADFTPIGDDV